MTIVAVVIPAFNEARFLPPLLSRLPYHVYVVDDGSTDGTRGLFRPSEAPKLRTPETPALIRHARNFGKGAALRTGIAAALADGAETIVTMDADGQHDPAALPRLLAVDADLVIGVRDRRFMPASRCLSNGFSAILLSLLTRRRFPDVHSGFRVYRAEKLRRLEIRSSRFEVEVELLLKAARAGWRIAHVPVPTLYGPERSKISPAKDAARFLRAVAWHSLWTSTPRGSAWSRSSFPDGESGTPGSWTPSAASPAISSSSRI